jgi:hypothetical protein
LYVDEEQPWFWAGGLVGGGWFVLESTGVGPVGFESSSRFSCGGAARRGVNPSRRGDVTEAVVLGELMECGVSVAVPFGDADRYDLIVDDGDALLRVQCKTGSWVNGTVRFNLYSSTVAGGERVDDEYGPDEVDAFAVYAPRMDEAYWVPFDATGAGEMRLRVEEPGAGAPRSRINWAREFRLRDRFDTDETGV